MRKLYDLSEDPCPLRIIHETVDHRPIVNLGNRAQRLKGHSGKSCRVAEKGP